MRYIFVVTLIIMQSVIFFVPEVFAEDTNENRTVAESLKESSSSENEKDEQAEWAETEESPESLATQNPFIIFLQMIAALAFVVVLIYFLLRFINKRSQSYRSTQVLQNIGGVPLGGSRSVQLVRVGDRLLVIGVGESIQLLKEIDDQDEIESLINQQEEQFEKIDRPINKLLQTIKGKKTNEEKIDNEKVDFEKILKNQLEDVKDSQETLRDAVRERDKWC